MPKILEFIFVTSNRFLLDVSFDIDKLNALIHFLTTLSNVAAIITDRLSLSRGFVSGSLVCKSPKAVSANRRSTAFDAAMRWCYCFELSGSGGSHDKSGFLRSHTFLCGSLAMRLVSSRRYRFQSEHSAQPRVQWPPTVAIWNAADGMNTSKDFGWKSWSG
jgi:hypothetical protein